MVKVENVRFVSLHRLTPSFHSFITKAVKKLVETTRNMKPDFFKLCKLNIGFKKSCIF